MPGTKNIFGPEEAVFAFFRLLLGTVICPKMTLKVRSDEAENAGVIRGGKRLHVACNQGKSY